METALLFMLGFNLLTVGVAASIAKTLHRERRRHREQRNFRERDQYETNVLQQIMDEVRGDRRRWLSYREIRAAFEFVYAEIDRETAATALHPDGNYTITHERLPSHSTCFYNLGYWYIASIVEEGVEEQQPEKQQPPEPRTRRLMV
jgi:hypothetical protein